MAIKNNEVEILMRKNEFRGINVYTSKFVYGNFVNNDVPYEGSRKKIFQIVNEDGIYINVIPTTVGQYIGRKDSKGVKIYEGDILRVKDLWDTYIPVFQGIIEFRDCSFVINKEDCSYHYRWMDYELEIIGNIYYNKKKESKECWNREIEKIQNETLNKILRPVTHSDKLNLKNDNMMKMAKKLNEEVGEVIEASAYNYNLNNSLTQELLDVMQMSLNMLNFIENKCGTEFGITMSQEIKKHNKKLEDRGWKFDNSMSLEIKTKGENNDI